jgi:predicted ester cyclase
MRAPAGYLDIIGLMRGRFPDVQWTLEEMVAEGATWCRKVDYAGTHRGAFFGVAHERFLLGSRIDVARPYFSSFFRRSSRRLFYA